MSNAEASLAPRPQTPKELLRELVKAEQKIKPEADSFTAVDTRRGPHIIHPGLDPSFRARSLADVNELADARYIRI